MDGNRNYMRECSQHGLVWTPNNLCPFCYPPFDVKILLNTRDELQDILVRIPYTGLEGVMERLEYLKRDLDYELRKQEKQARNAARATSCSGTQG